MTDVYEAIVALRRSGGRGALATIVKVKGSTPSEQASKMLVGEEGILCGTVGGGCVEADVYQVAREVMETGAPRSLTFDLHENPRYDTGLVCGGSLEIFVEPILPTPVVYVFGGGHVGLAVYRIARLAGLDVVVADDREAFASRERFPEAREVHAEPIEAVLPRLAPPPHGYVVIVTRGHKDDLKVLRWAVGTGAGYVGMLGSRRKVITLLRALEQEGVPEQQLARVNAPIGLDIGAVTPEEIGVSVVAELIALRRKATAGLAHKKELRPVVREVGAA